MGLNPVQSKEEARERGRRGGIASGEARRLKRDARAVLEALMAGKVKIDNKPMTRMEAICLAQIQKALEGDTRAFSAVLDRLEGKPTETAHVTQDVQSRVIDFGDQAFPQVVLVGPDGTEKRTVELGKE